MDNQRNLIIAVAVSVAIMFGFQYFFGKSSTERPPEAQQAQQVTPPSGAQAPNAQAPSPQAPNAPAPSAQQPASPTPTTVGAPADAGPRIKVETPRLAGSIALRGVRFDDLSLEDYHETVDPSSPTIKLL